MLHFNFPRNVIFLFLLFNGLLHSQVPFVEWDATIGGNETDRLIAVCTTPDGGFILAGHSTSGISGHKTAAVVGGYDYWIVKVNSIGDVVWDKTLGTIAHDYVVDVETANDGGYIIAGYTSGGISGDKTEAAIGGIDYWIIKLDDFGNIVWQNTIGGTANDQISEILKVPGGYVLSGYSASGIGGDKTEANIGGDDYWLLKINNGGTLVWQFTYGGTLNDQLVQSIRTTTGQYVMCGHSYSGISGDKTEANINFSDIWVLSIDGAGNILWQNTIGGLGSDEPAQIIELNTGGYLIGCNSTSNISGDKTEMSLNYFVDCCEDFGEGWWVNSYDFWIVKINETGEVLWENTIGETDSEISYQFIQTNDNRFVALGTSTNLDYPSDYYSIAIDSLGYPVWQDIYRGGYELVYDWGDYYYEHGYSTLKDALKLPDNTLLIAGYSDAIIGFDKTEGTVGGTEYDDYWILKLAPDTCTTFPIYADYDQDGNGAEYLTSACQPIDGYTINNSNDCNDRNSNVYPGAIEICDGIDNNCDGIIDEGIVDCNTGPQIDLEITIGGNMNDFIAAVVTTSSGYLFGGRTFSTTGEIVAMDILGDYILTKVAITGEHLWTKYYGGDAEDNLTDLITTTDNGFVIIGNSESGISGDKTEANMGGDDLWILKLDSLGNILWQNSIGGSGTDYGGSILQTPDGGYIIACRSSSNISGDKTENSLGSYDLWVIKLSATGIIEWQNTIGTSVSEGAVSVGLSTDGGYVLTVSTAGGISGDKTSPNLGISDIWILKLSNVGSILWQKSFGGTEYELAYKIEQTMDGGYLCSGYSNSGISATKSEVSISSDFWVIKLNALGNIIWENTIQAAGDEGNCYFLQDPEGGYLIAGSSDSYIGYDKTEASQLNPYYPFDWYEEGENDFWILKINEDGEILWQNTIGGNMDDELREIAFSVDGDIVLVGNSESFISGDKSEDNKGPFYEIFYDDTPFDETIYSPADYWLVRLNYSCTPALEACNMIDDNCNGLIDDDVIETISISPAGPTTFCQGNSVILNATTSGPNYQWKKNGVNIPGAILSSYTVTTKGTYTCETSSACDTEISTGIFVNVQKNPPASITAGGATTFCEGGSVVLTANTGAGLSYKWYKDAVLIPGATSINYTATTAGIYKCNVTKTATGCNKNSNGIMVTVPCKEGEELSSNSNFTIFPNPNNGTFKLVCNSPHGALSPLQGGPRGVIISLEIFNSLNQQIHSQQINSPNGNINETISIPNLSSGIYFVKLKTGNNYSQQKLIIE